MCVSVCLGVIMWYCFFLIRQRSECRTGTIYISCVRRTRICNSCAFWLLVVWVYVNMCCGCVCNYVWLFFLTGSEATAVWDHFTSPVFTSFGFAICVHFDCWTLEIVMCLLCVCMSEYVLFCVLLCVCFRQRSECRTGPFTSPVFTALGFAICVHSGAGRQTGDPNPGGSVWTRSVEFTSMGHSTQLPGSYFFVDTHTHISLYPCIYIYYIYHHTHRYRNTCATQRRRVGVDPPCWIFSSGFIPHNSQVLIFLCGHTHNNTYTDIT